MAELLFAKSTDPKYFGTAEKIRFLLGEAQIPFTEKETSESELKVLMANGRDTGVICGELPLLKIGDTYHETSANIMEIVAEMGDARNGTKLAGDAGDKHKLRAITNLVVEFEEKMAAETDKAAQKSLISVYFDLFNKMIAKNDKEIPGSDHYVYGDHFTYADVAMAAAVNQTTLSLGFMTLRPYSQLKEIHDKVVHRAAFEQRIQSRA